MMYYSPSNFVGHRINGYKANVCFLTKAAAEGLKQGQSRLKTIGRARNETLSLLVRDCYRPKKAVQEFIDWSHNSDTSTKSKYYPDLSKLQLFTEGYIAPISGHSRASTTDLTIVRLSKTGEQEPLPMGTSVDFLGERSHTDDPGISTEEKKNRQLLKNVLSPEFKNYDKEWWHYTLINEPYPKTLFDFDVESIK